MGEEAKYYGTEKVEIIKNYEVFRKCKIMIVKTKEILIVDSYSIMDRREEAISITQV